MNFLTDPPTILDAGVLDQDLRNCIATFPVMARHREREFQVRLQSTVDVIEAMEAGTLDNMNMGVIAPKSSFGSIPPRSLDDFEILFSGQFGGKWIKFQIRDVPDFYDPLSPSFTINLQSPHKGVR